MIMSIRKNKNAVLLTALIVLNFCLAAWGDEATNVAGAAGKNNTIVIKDFAFNPQTITVKSGEKVTWINREEIAGARYRR